MKVVSAITRLLVREHVVYPVAGLALNLFSRRVCSQDWWEEIISSAAHSIIDTSTAISVRTDIAEMVAKVGPYLSQDAVAVLRLIDEIAQKHSPEAN